MATEGRIRAPGGLSCREFVELVTDYFEDVLSPPLRARFETHLAACNGCQGYIDQMRDTLRLVGRLDDDAIPEDGRERLLDAFKRWRASR